MHFVYIIYSKKINKFYVGYSNNPTQRLKYHNLGKSGSEKSFTKRSDDWEIVYKKAFNDKIEALNFEKYLKKQKSRSFIENLVNVDW